MLNKVVGLHLATLLKKDPNTRIFCEFCVLFKNSCSYRTSLVAASVYFLLDELYFSLQLIIHIIN